MKRRNRIDAADGQPAGARGAGISRRQLGVAVFGSVGVTAVAMVAASRIRSPAQAAADSAAPPPSVLTEPIQKRVLDATVVLRGTVSAEQSVDVVAKGGTGTPVITAVNVKYGDLVPAATALIEISGRPVFALPGDIPSYRDLRPGSDGKDIAQLQAALASLGYHSDDQSGHFGTGTKTAVRKFYEAKGYEPLPASDEDGQLLTQAQAAVTSADRALRDAKTALQAAQQSGVGVPAATQAVADRSEDLKQAKAALATVQSQTGPMVPTGEVVFLKGFPARVDAVAASIGTVAKDKLLTVSAGRLVVRGGLSSYQKGLVRTGQPVQVLSELTGLTADATVSSVADSPTQPTASGASGGSDSGGAAGAAATYAMVAESTSPLDPKLAGQDVRLTITSGTSKDPVLVVPLAAVSAGSDGKTTVTVLIEGQPHRVEVTPGMVGDGYVQITPVSGATLTAGQQVVLGK